LFAWRNLLIAKQIQSDTHAIPPSLLVIPDNFYIKKIASPSKQSQKIATQTRDCCQKEALLIRLHCESRFAMSFPPSDRAYLNSFMLLGCFNTLEFIKISISRQFF